ncbi:SDR family oxidoreductase [Methylocapsa aurea]|uniref:SDR family oxidoreductase n=1 Tax=Methylocapsa aurea TaxID=663610 RepID=UPI00056D39DB|nr:SDR family oxidoreductase [Methylocapsa aurea]
MTGDKRLAIVTGASRGIGRATALRLAEDFGGLVLVARNEEGLASAADAIRAAGAQALPLAIDLSQPQAAEIIVARTLERFGRIDALVNVAGAVPQTDLFAMSDEEWADGLALKFHGARRLALNAWDALRQAGGSIVFMSGSSALAPKAALAAVGTINAAISALAKAFAERGVTDGVQVNAVLPGPVMTDRRRSMLEKYAVSKGLSFDAAIGAFARETGIARYGEPEDIAELIAFIVSSRARWMTGATLRMDGGEIKAV